MVNFRFWQKREKFLVLEVSAERTTGSLFSVDAEKNIEPEKIWEEFMWGQVSRRFRHHLENWKVIVSADPALALTTILPVKLEREASLHREPLSGVELENLLAQAIAKVFNQCRGEASRALGIDELDTIVIDNRVNNFKIDHHHVLNPLDFRAKRIDAILELTLTTRSIFNDWKTFFNIGETRNFFFTESARAELFTIKKIKSPPINLLVIGNPGPSQFFRLEKAALGEVIHRGKVNWSSRAIVDAIEENLGVSPTAALKIYHLYLKKEVSARIARHLNLLLKPILAPLFRQIEHSKMKGPVYIDTAIPLPSFLPRRHGAIVLSDLPIDGVIDKLGFRVDFSQWPWPPSRIFKHLAPFFEFYYNTEDLPINHWLRRRLHWLGSPR